MRKLCRGRCLNKNCIIGSYVERFVIEERIKFHRWTSAQIYVCMYHRVNTRGIVYHSIYVHDCNPYNRKYYLSVKLSMPPSFDTWEMMSNIGNDQAMERTL